MSVKAWGQLYVGADPPAEDPVIVGSVWVDTDNGLVKRCSSVDPYTWVTVSGGVAGDHAETHQHGGDDEVATATPGANVIPKAGAGGKLAAGFLQEVLSHADLTDAPEAAHHAKYTDAEVEAIVAVHAAIAAAHHERYTDEEVDAIVAAHAAIAAAHHAKYTDAEALVQGEAAVTTHEGEEDPHAQYQKESEKDAANGYAGLDANGLVPEARVHGDIARDSEVADAITTHEEGEDPHPVYLTPAEHTAVGDEAPHHVKYTDAEALAQGEAAVAGHVEEADPHTQYRKEISDYCMVYRDSVQSIASGATTPVSWSHALHDTNEMWDIGDPTHIVIKKAGLYQVIGHAVWAAVGSTDVRFWLLQFERGETPDVTMFSAQMFNSVDVTSDRDIAAIVTGFVALEVDDKVRLDVRQFTGNNLNIQAWVSGTPNSYWRPWLQVLYLGPLP